MKARLIFGGTLVLTLFALPAVADPADQTAELWAAIFAAPRGTGALPVVIKPGGPGGVWATSVCTAYCWDGTTRTCSGSSCSAVDSSCPSQRGSCWSDLEGTKYCPECTCYASTTCSDGSAVSCQGGPGCFSVDQCYATCDGQYYLCPNTPPYCPP